MVQREISSVTSRAQQVKVAPGRGTWLWILQRLTSWGLLLFLGIHLYMTYFARLDAPNPLTFEFFNQRFSMYPFFFALNETLLLVCALFHGLNGLRTIIYDWTTHQGLRRTSNILLLVTGVGFAIYGIWTLWALANTVV